MRSAMTVVALGALLASAPAQADVVAAMPVHQFGVVEQGSPIEHGFALKNKSRAWVRIEGTQSSCGCTVAAADGQLVQPGAITWVRVRLDTTSIPAGRTTKTITVRTSDARTPAVQLALTGVVLADLVIAPTPVYFGRVFQGELVRRELVVLPGRPGESTFAVSAVETDSPTLRAYLVAGDKPGQQKVIVELDYAAPVGRFTDHVTVRTTSPRQPVITIPVFGHVLG